MFERSWTFPPPPPPPPKYSEFQMAKLSWEYFWKMVTFLGKDDMLLPSGSQTTAEDIYIESHSVGYTELDLEVYRLVAEKFYQLFCARHGALNLTPYKIKLIDHSSELMKDLPFSLAQFQSEGAEHINYYDSKLHHGNTTRHGGKDRFDPVLASFHHRWITQFYSLHEYSSSDDESKSAAGQHFLLYCIAAVIQKVFKGHLVRKKFHHLGWWSYRMASEAVRNSILPFNHHLAIRICL